jgi:hypothetical protein
MTWWKGAFRSLGAVTGLFAAGLGAATSVAAQDSNYRSAASAPAAWQTFAKQLKARFEQRLAADDPEARKLQDDMAKQDAENAKPLTFGVRAWIRPDGEIERVEFDGLDDDNLKISLRAILGCCEVGAPPSDMLQPLRLRLSLRPKDQPGAGK